MDYDRLRDLQAKFDENPRRYFAPLANEYRKAGNPKRAIEICRAHLSQLPGHMSGQVVYGQALFEGAEYDEARKVFEGAIVLDPENLIALRALGDLALQAGNSHEARTWYSRLLDADPKDAAVIALVAEIDGAGPSDGDSTFTVDFSFVDAPAGAPAAPPVVADPDAGATIGDSLGVDGLSSKAPEPESPLSNVEASAAASEPDSALADVEASAAARDADSALSNIEGREQPDPESVEPRVEASVSAPETASTESDAPLGLERHYPAQESSSAPTPPPPPPPASPPAAEVRDPVMEPMGADRDALDNWSPPPSAAVHQEAAPAPESDPQPATSSFAGGSNPEPFVNETMAQLYLQQGYRQLALRVYRQLAEMRPDEQALKDRIAEIVAAQTAEDRGGPRSPAIESPLPHGPASEPGSVERPSFDRQPVDSPPASAPSHEPDSVESPVRKEPRADPKGIAARQPSIREFFATLGRRRPAPPAAPATWGRSDAGNGPVTTEPGSSASLDAVFAGANVSAKDARAASALAGAFSASARGAAPPPPPAATQTPRGNPRLQTQESEEDVAKFRAWLDGLTGE